MNKIKRSTQKDDTLILLSYIGLLSSSTINMVGYMIHNPIIQGLSILGTLTSFSCLSVAAISCAKEDSKPKSVKSTLKNEPRSF